ncbi:hypothetical protein B0T22DRAFT_6073 [Podospora appendiculata]|uniref:Uncharacterized protein n=1 Tax=Podospora appendiculata TaxID=314037 RepID=A0AAE1CF15_9PEZI|nr:hypothetical protein B0T22DRAFT_6073 [Podospora appendiculata]
MPQWLVMYVCVYVGRQVDSSIPGLPCHAHQSTKCYSNVRDIHTYKPLPFLPLPPRQAAAPGTCNTHTCSSIAS